MTDALHEQLKHETWHLHKQLEKTALAHQLSTQTITHRDYIRYLEIMGTVHCAVEPLCQSFPQFAKFDFLLHEHSRCDLIKQDLSHLCANSAVPTIWLQKPTQTFITKFEHAIGYLYVLEGSTMGGQILAPKLHQRRPELRPALNYLTGYGAATAQRWQSFWQFIARFQLSGDCCEQEIIHAARHLFSHLIEEMSHDSNAKD